MLSSIFNSKDWRFIAGSLTVATMMLICYHLLVTSGFLKAGAQVTGAGENQEKVEKYAFSAENPAVIALGSSYFNRVVMADDRGSSIVNLCLPGLSAANGIEVLLMTKKTPRVVLFEVSNMLCKADNNTVREIISPERRFLISMSPMFRVSYHPSLVLLRLLRHPGKAKVERRRGWDVPKVLTSELFARKIRFKVSDPPLSATERLMLAKNLKAAKQWAEKAVNTRFLLVRVPQSSRMAKSRSELEINQMAEQVFPQNQYTWITAPNDDTWSTTDGYHLDVDSSSRFKTMLLTDLGKFARQEDFN